MTAKETEALISLKAEIKLMSVKLFGDNSSNGTRIGCIDQRLESVEDSMKEIKNIMPKMVTREYCSKRHETKWSRIVLSIGVIATWAGLILFAVDIF